MDASMLANILLGTATIPSDSFTPAIAAKVIDGLFGRNWMDSLTGFSPLGHILDPGDPFGNGTHRKVPLSVVEFSDPSIDLKTHCREVLFRYTWDHTNNVRHDKRLFVLRRRKLMLWDGYCRVRNNRVEEYSTLKLSILGPEGLEEFLQTPGDFRELRYSLTKAVEESTRAYEARLEDLKEINFILRELDSRAIASVLRD